MEFSTCSNSAEMPLGDDFDFVGKIIWDDDVQVFSFDKNDTFDPMCESLTLGSIKNFNYPLKNTHLSNSNDSYASVATTETVSTTSSPLESSRAYAINLLDKISKELEFIDNLDLLHQEYSTTISKFGDDVGLFLDHFKFVDEQLTVNSGDISDIYASKINISKTILSLKQIATFLPLILIANDYLANKDYNSIAFILLICKKLLCSLEDVVTANNFQVFNEYNAQLLNNVKNCAEKDLNDVLKGIDLTLEYPEFKITDCCLCAELIDSTIKHQIIDAFVSRYMEQYNQCFRCDKDGLEFLRRLSWFRRNKLLVADAEKKFPPNWSFTLGFTNKFFLEASRDLETLLAKHKTPVTELDLYSKVKVCKEFEVEQNQAQSLARITLEINPKFNIMNYPIINRDDLQLKYVLESKIVDFSGYLTNCFEGYLGSWLHSQETSLTNFLLPLDSNEVAVRKNDLNVYISSFQLFTKFKNVLNLAISVSTEQTLLEAFQMLKRVLKLYHQLLVNRWNFGNNRDFSRLCVEGGTLVGTSLYCESMFMDMEKRTCEVIRDLYQPICKRHDMLDIFSALRSSVVSKVIDVLCERIDLKAWYFEKLALFKEPVDNFIIDAAMAFDSMLNECIGNFSQSCHEYICNKTAMFLFKSFKDCVCGGEFGTVALKQINSDIALLEKYLLNLEMGEGAREIFHRYIREEITFITKFLETSAS